MVHWRLRKLEALILQCAFTDNTDERQTRYEFNGGLCWITCCLKVTFAFRICIELPIDFRWLLEVLQNCVLKDKRG